MKTHELDWSDIPFLLAVCKAGTLAGAARSMNVHHSTVFRRVESVEKKLGVRLFEKLNHKYILTIEGEYFYARALQLQSGMNEIERSLSGKDLRLEGILTITTTNSVLYTLTPLLTDFQREYPETELRIISEAKPLDLAQRDADIAIRPTSNPPEHWIGRNITPISFAPYIHTEHRDIDEQDLRWLVLSEDFKHSPMSKLTSSLMPDNAPRTVINNMLAVYDFVKQGLGVGVLPCYLGDSDNTVRRLKAPDPSYNWDLWILSHPDLRNSAKVKAFNDFAVEKMKTQLSSK